MYVSGSYSGTIVEYLFNFLLGINVYLLAATLFYCLLENYLSMQQLGEWLIFTGSYLALYTAAPCNLGG